MGARIMLLQDAVYVPSYGGGNKANRLLLTALVTRGFECHAVSRMPATDRVLADRFSAEALTARGIAVTRRNARHMAYRYKGVEVEALDMDDSDAASWIDAILRDVRPDWILVSDDRPAMLLDVALAHAPERVVALVHTHFHLPFGPDANAANPEQHGRLRHVRAIVAVSDYSRAYIRSHGGLDSTVLHFPVFGDGPFDPPERPEAGAVTMINPCLVKGLPIFLDLAAHFPETRFAAVPTWGGDEAVLSALARLPNMTLLEPADDVGAILRDTRILLAPSLIPETFGYVAVDAMLRAIPVLAGNLGGQPEAKLGVDFVLPVTPARRTEPGYVAAPQDIAPWQAALDMLLSDDAAYRRCADTSRAAALRFLPETDADHFARYLNAL